MAPRKGRRKVCPAPGCPTLIPTTATGCTTHRRPSPAQRGYGHAHQVESRQWIAKVARGELVTCWRCGEPITDPDDCDLGHDDHDRSITRGPEHARRCNRSAAGRASHA